MKITKLGHCCLVIEESDVTIMTDPGAYSTGQESVTGLDAVLITHEHADHLHMESLKAVLANNSGVRVITNSAVNAILAKENIASEVVGDGQRAEVNELLIEGFGTKHAYIYSTVPDVENTGYFIGDKLFYPGDAFYNPKKKVDVLALPISGPWMKISEAMDYAKEIKPRVCFPVHDGILHPERPGAAYRVPNLTLPPLGIQFAVMKEGSVENF